MQCPLCASSKISEETEHVAAPNHLKFKDHGTTIWNADLKVRVDRARVCHDCGFVMLFVDDSAKQKLAEAFGGD